ncbi:hypothetical protein SALBM135S_04104 [Streptomyces alboniger]
MLWRHGGTPRWSPWSLAADHHAVVMGTATTFFDAVAVLPCAWASGCLRAVEPA